MLKAEKFVTQHGWIDLKIFIRLKKIVLEKFVRVQSRSFTDMMIIFGHGIASESHGLDWKGLICQFTEWLDSTTPRLR